LNTAEYFRLDRDIGGIAPGRFADILFIDNLPEFSVSRVTVNGKLIAERGELLAETAAVSYPEWAVNTVKLRRELSPADFVFSTGKKDQVEVRVIKVFAEQIVSYEEKESLKVVGGAIQPDPAKDILKLVVVERYAKTPPNIGHGFVRGFGFKDGAIATSISPDIHQLIAVGRDEHDIAAALNRLIAIQGGVVVCRGGNILAELSLPMGGLMTAQPYEETIEALEAISRAAGELGCVLPSPLMTLAFAGCPTLVEFKLSDKGLINILEGSLATLEVD
jgi:adenine deaminase